MLGGGAWQDAWQGELGQSWEIHSPEVRGQGSLPEPFGLCNVTQPGDRTGGGRGAVSSLAEGSSQDS